MAVYDIDLDPRNEEQLLDQATRYIFNKSNGSLSNLNPSNPLIFLLEAQVFSGAELLWYVNQLPKKLLLNWLNYFIDDSVTPAKATGILTINLTAPLSSAYTMPVIEVSDGQYSFITTSPTLFPAGTTQQSAIIEAVDVGNQYNLPPFSINQIITPVAFLSSVTNLNATTGGISQLSNEDALDMFVSQYRDGLISSVEDIELAVKKITGILYSVRAKYEDGIRVYIGSPTTAVPLSLIKALYKSLQERMILTAPLYIQEFDYVPVNLTLYVETQDDTDLVADQLSLALSSLFEQGITSITRTDLIKLVLSEGVEYKDGWINNGSSTYESSSDNQLLSMGSVIINVNDLAYYYGKGDVD